jgi:hypothetical protein
MNEQKPPTIKAHISKKFSIIDLYKKHRLQVFNLASIIYDSELDTTPP